MTDSPEPVRSSQPTTGLRPFGDGLLPPNLAWPFVLGLLILVTAMLLRPLAHAIAWAFVLAGISWPVYARLRSALGGRTNTAAVLSVLLVTGILMVPAGIIVGSLAREIGPAYDSFMKVWQSPPPLPAFLESWPGAQEMWGDLQAVMRRGGFLGREVLLPLLRPGSAILAGFVKVFLEGLLALFTLFFIYRNGERYSDQARAVATHLLGERSVRLARPIRGALRAVFAGVIGAAVAEGIVGAIGYAIAGVEAPVLLGVATAACAMLPFGAGLVWVPLTVALFLQGKVLWGFFILAWSLLVIGTIPHFVRPYVISNATRLPYLQTLIAILGGLGLFGLLGLFLGPAILAVWIGLWDDWTEAGRERLGSSLVVS